jgi:hypothetical protein
MTVYLNIETTPKKFEVDVAKFHLGQLVRAVMNLLRTQVDQDQWEDLGDSLRASITIENITMTVFFRFEPDVDEAVSIVRVTTSDGENLFAAITKDGQTLVETYSPGSWERLVFSHLSTSLH